MLRVLVIAATALALFAPAAGAKPKCVSHGREIRNLQHVTCNKAKSVANHFWSYVEGPSGWTCQRTKGLSFYRGYCETTDDKSYFSWRPLD